jgi:NhaA family Na+:H+ antiporter
MTEKSAPPPPPSTGAPWEKTFERVLTPFEEFLHNQTSSSKVLMATALIALVIANSPWADAYHHLIELPLSLHAGPFALEKTLHHWINDGLMTLFFFLVGLEIKREILVGELAAPRQATLPILAAIGGMVVPALIYWLINADGPGARGWGIPMATDIAFAVGAMVLLGERVPKNLIVFLAALAIVDDLGAVLVIALFYTDHIALDALGAAAAMFGTLIAFNLGGIRRALPYFLVGSVMWLFLFESGIHATLAGILMAITIPARPKYHPERFRQRLDELAREFAASHEPHGSILTNQRQFSVVQTLENAAQAVQTPLQRLEHAAHLPVGLIVIPIFALANAGVPIDVGAIPQVLTNPITLGVVCGLLFGKFIGIAGVAWLAVRLGVAQLPRDVTLPHVAGAAMLGGIGFTMSIFIAQLAFEQMPEYLLLAKTGILAVSVTAGVAGTLYLRWLGRARVE